MFKSESRAGKEVADSAVADEYVTAKQAMQILNVNAQTLYAYVSRKGIRSRPVPGTRQRLYWKSDLEQIGRKRKSSNAVTHAGLVHESGITLITNGAHFYRGRKAADLARDASFEAVAALLWDVDEKDCFDDTVSRTPAVWPSLNKLLANESDVNRATALFPLLEEANPKAYDLSRVGMARTGAHILRWLAALTAGANKPSNEPIHLFLARHLKLRPAEAELVRRMLVLSADHGFDACTLTVREIASTGVTPWRAVISGLSAALGRKSRRADFNAISFLVSEIVNSADPVGVIVRRLRDSEHLPGFDSAAYPLGDPRGRVLLSFCEEIFADDLAFKRLQSALQTMREAKHLEPNYAFVCLFVTEKLKIGTDHSIFHLGRAAGWIAHAIEQYQIGEATRLKGLYKGPLP
jgi:citrate synthase